MIPGVDMDDLKYLDFHGFSSSYLPSALLAIPEQETYNLYWIEIQYPQDAKTGKEVLRGLEYKVISHETVELSQDVLEIRLTAEALDDDLGVMLVSETVPLHKSLDYKLRLAVMMYSKCIKFSNNILHLLCTEALKFV